MKTNSYLLEDFFVYPLFVCFDPSGLVPRPLEICTVAYVVNSQSLLKEVILLTVCTS